MSEKGNLSDDFDLATSDELASETSARESGDSANAANITSDESKISALEADVTALQSVATTLEGEVATLESEVAALQNQTPPPVTTPPAAPVITSPVSGAKETAAITTVSGTAVVGASVDIFDGTASWGVVTASSTGAWTYTTNSLSNGSYTITATATTSNGTSVPSAAVTFTVAVVTPPTPPAAPVISAPAPGATVNTSTPTVSGTAVATAVITVYDGTTVWGTTSANASGAWTLTLPSLTNGNYTVTATATTNNGTSALSNAVSFTVSVVVVVTPPPGNLPSGVTLQAIDGGNSYFSKFSNPAPFDTQTFPIGTWAPSGFTDQASLNQWDGLVNMFVDEGYVPANWQSSLNSAGFYGIGGSSDDVGAFVTDEVDLWAGAGSQPWSGQINSTAKGAMCTGQGSTLNCGYTAIQTMIKELPSSVTGRFKYVNYSKEAVCGTGQTSDANGLAVGKEWASFVDVFSCDIYWFQEQILTQPYWSASTIVTGTGGQSLSVAQVRQASNYGRTVARMRTLAGNAKPVWSFHEVAGYFTNNSAGVPQGPTPQQLVAGMWSSIINGSRGVIMFVQDYIDAGGNANAFQDTRYAAHKSAVEAFYTQVQSLQTIILGQNAVGLVKVVNGPIDMLVKWNSGTPYIFAHQRDQSSSTPTFSVTGFLNGLVNVVGENRSIQMTAGTFTDTFADGNTVHIYELTNLS